MLSINIPVYNCQVTSLIDQLSFQAETVGIKYEIRVYDDHSEENFRQKNRQIGGLPNVIYKELDQNLGRSAIRNLLGSDAVYEYLLFIDADSLVIQTDYLRKYLDSANQRRVVCGGTAYSSQKPEDEHTYLRWYYGKNRESISAAKRKSSKGFIITSNNFLIPKQVFREIHFRESIGQYGHEDTLLGFDLFNGGIEIHHIDNPLEHIGLEDSTVFLEKTRIALKSLHKIKLEILNGNSVFAEQVHFLKRYNQINKWIPSNLLKVFFHIFHEKIEKNLLGKNPRLFLFDAYKLSFYATLK